MLWLICCCYNSDRWNTASNYSRVPIRTEVMADKLQPDGTIYTVHHVYDYFNFLPVVNADPTVFQVLQQPSV